MVNNNQTNGEAKTSEKSSRGLTQKIFEELLQRLVEKDKAEHEKVRAALLDNFLKHPEGSAYTLKKYRLKNSALTRDAVALLLSVIKTVLNKKDKIESNALEEFITFALEELTAATKDSPHMQNDAMDVLITLGTKHDCKMVMKALADSRIQSARNVLLFECFRKLCESNNKGVIDYNKSWFLRLCPYLDEVTDDRLRKAKVEAIVSFSNALLKASEEKSEEKKDRKKSQDKTESKDKTESQDKTKSQDKAESKDKTESQDSQADTQDKTKSPEDKTESPEKTADSPEKAAPQANTESTDQKTDSRKKTTDASPTEGKPTQAKSTNKAIQARKVEILTAYNSLFSQWVHCRDTVVSIDIIQALTALGRLFDENDTMQSALRQKRKLEENYREERGRENKESNANRLSNSEKNSAIPPPSKSRSNYPLVRKRSSSRMLSGAAKKRMFYYIQRGFSRKEAIIKAAVPMKMRYPA